MKDIKKKTRIAFIVDHKLVFEPLGIMQLSAILRKEGYSVKLFEKDKNLIFKIRNYNPQLACYSVIAGSEKSYFELNSLVKSYFPEIISIFGGPYPTYNHDFFTLSSDIDAICIGEGDYALLDLANKIEENEDFSNIENFYVKKDGVIIKNDIRRLVENLDELPFVDREIVYEANNLLYENGVKRFLISRGCPFDCSFCFNHSYKALYHNKGKTCRSRSIEGVLVELEEIKEKYPLECVKFLDDILFPQFLKDFLPQYKKRIGLPFNCSMRADQISKNPEIAKLLKDAGCFFVTLGLEAANDNIRKTILNKNIGINDIKRACKLLKENGIKVMTSNIIGSPTETSDMALETLKLNMEADVDFAVCALLQPYKGTKVYDYAVTHGHIEENYDSYDIFYNKSPIKFKSKSEKRMIVNLQKFFHFACRNKSLYFLITKIIVKIPPNKIFNAFNRIYDYYLLGKLYPTRFSRKVIFMFLKNYFTFQKA